MGSPPLTRGTQTKGSFDLIKLRITPAYAGNTLQHLHLITCKGDHPRLRGEHLQSLVDVLEKRGSPPLTRGTQPKFKFHLICTGITPAYAGNTLMM